MKLNAEQLVFIDTLMDLGFVQFDEDRDSVNFQRSFKAETWKGASTITVKFLGGGLWITWWNGQGSPDFVYQFPKNWVQAITFLKELITVADRSAESGKLEEAPESDWRELWNR